MNVEEVKNDLKKVIELKGGFFKYGTDKYKEAYEELYSIYDKYDDGILRGISYDEPYDGASPFGDFLVVIIRTLGGKVDIVNNEYVIR